MTINKSERIVLQNEVREIYEAYQDRKGQIERVIRDKIEREIAAEHGDALRDLSRALHEYHRKGLPKAALRVATKKYGNNDEFVKLWDAYTPEDQFTMAVGRSTTPVFEWRDNVLYVHKHPTTGEALAHSIALPLYNEAGVHYGGYLNVEPHLTEMVGGWTPWIAVGRDANKEIKRAFEAGEITESTNPYDYVNDLPENKREAYLKTEEQKNFDYNSWITKEN